MTALLEAPGAVLAGALAAADEVALGDPRVPTAGTGFAAAVRRDGERATPAALAAVARAAGLPLSFVPAALGGTLTTFDETLLRVRAYARRDAAVMPATLFSVTATTCLLVHGSPAQQQRAVAVLAAGGSVAFAMSEAASGSDLLAATGTLVPDGDGWLLDATKWLVGQGASSELVHVVARTAPRGPLALTAVLLERDALRAGTVTGTQHATGLTGTGLDVLELRAQPVPADAVVGAVGSALESGLQSMQVVRLLSTAASLGCADTAVRSTVGFLAGHRVGGRSSLDWVPARRELGAATAALVALDTVSTVAARLLHVRPAAFTLPSAVVKRVATEGAALVVDACGDLQASRSVLEDGPDALLAKLRRDVDTVRYIDTSPAAVLRLLAGQLPQVAGARAAVGREQQVLERAAQVFGLSEPLPAYRPDLLDLATRDDDVVSGLALVLPDVLRVLEASDDPSAARAAQLVAAVGTDLQALLDGVDDDLRAGDGGVRALDAAAAFASRYAAAACVQLWWWNRTAPLWGQPPGSLAWLVAALAVLGEGRTAPADDLLPAADLAVDLVRRSLLCTAVPVPIAEGLGGRDDR